MRGRNCLCPIDESARTAMSTMGSQSRPTRIRHDENQMELSGSDVNIRINCAMSIGGDRVDE